MKKIIAVVVSIISILFLYNYNVYAKDTAFSLKKYNEENLLFMEDSYNEKGNIDGIVSAGTYLKELVDLDDKEYEDYQVMLIKYNSSGKLLWKFSYGKTIDDKLDALSYTYDEKGNINGYLLVVQKTRNINDEVINTPNFILVDFEGKEDKVIESNLNNTEINKIIVTSNSNKTEYIIIGHREKDSKVVGVLAKYDSKLNLLWEREYVEEKNTDLIDITYTKDNNVINYMVIRESENTYKLLKYDSNGNFVKEVKSDFEEGDNPKLETSNKGFILYGITNEVKLKNNKSTSYYLEKYNLKEEKEWETIGTEPVDSTGKMSLKGIISDDNLEEYLMMYRNDDKSIEIVKINTDGSIVEKTKKINNDYYDINSFSNKDRTIYFVGQINCPEDDNCDYETNSLFLISDEEKVIEVESDTKTNMIVLCLGVAALVAITVLIKKRKTIDKEIIKLQKKKKK